MTTYGTSLDALRPEWTALADATGAPPFGYPEWTEAWMSAFGRGRLELATLVREDRLAAVLPLDRTLGRIRSLTSWQVPELPFAAEGAAAREELLADVFALGSPCIEIDFLSADAVDDPVAVVAARGAWRRPLVHPRGRAPYVELTGTFADYQAGLSRNRRRSLRRGWNGLRAEGPVSVEVWSGGDDLDERLAEVYAVEAAGWKGRQGSAILSSRATSAFFSDVARWAAARGWLRLSFLRVAGRPVAADLSLVHGGTWFSLKAGYDERWRELGPGALLLQALIERAFDAGLHALDLLGDADAFKDAWATASRPLVRVEAFRPTPQGAVGFARTHARPYLGPVVDRLRGSATPRGSARGGLQPAGRGAA